MFTFCEPNCKDCPMQKPLTVREMLRLGRKILRAPVVEMTYNGEPLTNRQMTAATMYAKFRAERQKRRGECCGAAMGPEGNCFNGGECVLITQAKELVKQSGIQPNANRKP